MPNQYNYLTTLAELGVDLSEWSWTNSGPSQAPAPSHQILHHEKREVTGSETNEPDWTAPFTPLKADNANDVDTINVGGEPVPAGWTIHYKAYYTTEVGVRSFHKVDEHNNEIATARRHRTWNTFSRVSYWTEG